MKINFINESIGVFGEGKRLVNPEILMNNFNTYPNEDMFYFYVPTYNEVIDAVKKDNFALFRENFAKNNGGFPYCDGMDAKYIMVKNEDGDCCALLAYATPRGIEKYRESWNMEDYMDYAHLFDIEVLSKYRGMGIMKKMLKSLISALRDEKRFRCKGMTLMAIDKKMAEGYEKVLGAKTDKRFGTESSPFMVCNFR